MGGFAIRSPSANYLRHFLSAASLSSSVNYPLGTGSGSFARKRRHVRAKSASPKCRRKARARDRWCRSLYSLSVCLSFARLKIRLLMLTKNRSRRRPRVRREWNQESQSWKKRWRRAKRRDLCDHTRIPPCRERWFHLICSNDSPPDLKIDQDNKSTRGCSHHWPVPDKSHLRKNLFVWNRNKVYFPTQRV